VQEGSNTVLSSVTLIGPSAVPLEIPGVLPDSAECWAVNGVWTLPGARRRGIGRETAQAAMRYAAGQAAAKGKDCLLTTVVYADNTGAGVYYEKLGFVAYREGLDGDRPTCELALLIPREGERVAF
jgi:GNAT superfamily N-acetyltransferase